MQAFSHRDLVVVCAWAFAALLAVLFIESPLLRIVAGAPLLLLLTGHAVLRAIGFRGVSVAEHMAYAVGASIAMCLAGGFFLNSVGCLTPIGWALWLAAVAGAATLITAYWHPGATPALPRVGLPDFSRWHAATLTTAALVVYCAHALAVRDEARQRQFTYTEFWMLSGAPAAPERLTVGISSAEPTPRRFDVEVRLDGSTIAVWRSVAVTPKTTWTREITVALGAGHMRKAEALLYEPVGNVLYRKVSAIIPGT